MRNVRRRAAMALLISATVAALLTWQWGLKLSDPNQISAEFTAAWGRRELAEWDEWATSIRIVPPWRRFVSIGGASQFDEDRYFVKGYDGGPFWEDEWSPSSSRMRVAMPQGRFILVDWNGVIVRPGDALPRVTCVTERVWIIVGNPEAIHIVNVREGGRVTIPR